MRDRIKSIEYFDRIIVRDIRRINNFQNKLNNNEVKKNRIPSIENKIRNIKLEIFYAKYSRGDNFEELTANYIKDFKEKLNTIPDLFNSESYSYVANLEIMSLGKLLNFGSLVKEIYEPLLKKANINDWLYNFILFEENTDALFLWEDPYKLISTLVNAEDGKRISILKDYLDNKWYKANVDVGWYDSHKSKIDVYTGYWSFEAGAVAKILGLDDNSLKNQQYYPYDMVHFKG